jgi:RNA binding exosome subunit
VPRKFASLHARVICHATESPEKVEQSLRNVVGDAPVSRTVTEGHHGNSIQIMEVTIEREDEIEAVLRRLSRESLEEISDTLPSRLDDSCNLFVRFDKQEALGGRLVISRGEDVIVLRIKILAFPARREVASEIMTRFLAK